MFNKTKLPILVNIGSIFAFSCSVLTISFGVIYNNMHRSTRSCTCRKTNNPKQKKVIFSKSLIVVKCEPNRRCNRLIVKRFGSGERENHQGFAYVKKQHSFLITLSNHYLIMV